MTDYLHKVPKINGCFRIGLPRYTDINTGAVHAMLDIQNIAMW